MINLYSGTPGSGKSLHLARVVSETLRIHKDTVIANFPINLDVVSNKGKKKIGKFIYLQNDELTVPYLIEHAQKHHKIGKEGQTLLVIDEAGIMFNSRDYGSFDRKAWINFMMTHRHYGYNIILVSQFDRMLDRQIRAFIEYEIKHRKANNLGWIGFFLTLLRIPFFVAVKTWYGMRLKDGADFFVFRKRDAKLYDTMMLFGGDHHGNTIGSVSSSASASDGDTVACGGGAPSEAEQKFQQPECSTALPPPNAPIFFEEQRYSLIEKILCYLQTPH